MTLRRKALFALALPLALSACGSGLPSSTEAQRALAQQYEQATGQPGVVRGYDGFTLSGCVDDSAGDGVRCDVSGNVVLIIAGAEHRLPLGGAVRFSKASGEWTAHRVTD